MILMSKLEQPVLSVFSAPQHTTRHIHNKALHFTTQHSSIKRSTTHIDAYIHAVAHLDGHIGQYCIPLVLRGLHPDTLQVPRGILVLAYCSTQCSDVSSLLSVGDVLQRNIYLLARLKHGAHSLTHSLTSLPTTASLSFYHHTSCDLLCLV